MVDVLFDTNIFIYLFDGHPTYLHFLRTIAGKTVGMSIITYMEVLIGAHDDSEEKDLRIFLDNFEVVPLSIPIAQEVAGWVRQKKRKGLRHPGASDTIIAQTALFLNVSLVTNNPKDFTAFTGLRTVVPG